MTDITHMMRATPLRLGTLLAFLLLLLAACSPEQTATLNLVNQERQAAGLTTLLPSPHANTKAQAWAEHLAQTNTLTHSDLTEGMPDGFLLLGENVGRGPSIEAIQQAFMNSPGHRENILDPEFSWGGTGYAVAANGTVYVVQVFADYSS